MTLKTDTEEIKKLPFGERIELIMHTVISFLRPEEGEHVLLVAFSLDEDGEHGQIHSVVHTSPGNAESVLHNALEFYTKYEACRHEKVMGGAKEDLT